MRKFEKISYDMFKKEIKEDIKLYNLYNIPVRKTKCSAGYDFELLEDLTLEPNEIKIVPTGVKISMKEDEMLMIIVRSSIGFKYNVRLTNQVGIIESDYYNNPTNEGHIKISIQNHGINQFIASKGSSIAQGIITKFLTVEDEKKIKSNRIGGFGSTNNRVK